ncbi:MAG: SGNH/GDSL hydrolase family protein, partial [Sedimentisphaerales bacterium]|nr:SGNH/GDSL hydrolase family protein [Sedimentisphaerales bacterium]
NYVRENNKHNSLAYRSDEIEIPKPEGQFRIVCMGGSTTYTTEVEDYHLSYPNLLETELKSRGYDHVRVINAGVGSWTSYESLINFELRILDLEPDMIIVYHAVNDILTRLVWPPEAYKGDNSGAAAPVAMTMPSILEYSTLLRYLMIRADIIKPHSSMDRQLAAKPDSSWSLEFYDQKVKGTYPEAIFKTASAQKMFETNQPKYFKRNIEHIALIANHRGIKTVLATFAYSPEFTNVPTVASEEFKTAFTEMNETLKSIASEMAINLFDFARVFPVDKGLFTDGLHVNIEGVRLKAKLFADYLIENKLVPKTP